jgi:pyrimidine operon attenuation protein / uracil phosphoribosyltransferase
MGARVGGPGRHEQGEPKTALGSLKACLSVCYISRRVLCAVRQRPVRKVVVMSSDEETVCGAEETEVLIAGMGRKIWDGRRPGEPFYLIGVRTRGVPLAQRLAQELTLLANDEVVVGAVDITLYRDDLGRGRRWPVLRGTEIPFPVDGAEIVLVDDVLFTGRTIRAALNSICDLGRPARIRLAVLVDRGHRELPIQPDVVGLHLPTDRSDRVRVRLHPVDPAEEIVRVLAASRPSQSDRSPAP